MMEMLIGATIALVSLYIGFSMGKGSSIIPEETKRQVKRLIQALPIKRDIGGVESPTKADVDRFNDPIVQAEEKAMSDTFSNIIPKNDNNN